MNDPTPDLLAQVPPGPRIEFGVLHGGTLALMVQHDGPTYGVDSFEGFREPGPLDGTQYPKGRFKVSPEQVNAPGAVLIKGWVPDVLPELPQGPFAFAHIDMDHYEPTVAALVWIWDRMLPGGIICGDDYFPNRPLLAARALEEWANVHPPAGTQWRKIWWVR